MNRVFLKTSLLVVTLIYSLSIHHLQASPPMLIVDPENPRWLRWSDGAPFFLCGPGDPENFLFRGELQPDGTRKGDQSELMKKVAASGANCLYWVGMRSHGGDGDETENMFVEGNPQKGLNEAVLQQWEGWLAEAESLGLVVFFFFYDDEVNVEIGKQSLNWMLDTEGNLHPQEAAMVDAIVERFTKFGNIVWGTMEVADKRGERFNPHLKAFSKHLRRSDPNPHPIAMSIGFRGDDFSYFANDPHVDIFNIMKLENLSAEEIHQRGLGYYSAARDRYVCNFAETHGYGKGPKARRKNWATAMSGCYVMVHGHHIDNNSEQDLIDCGRVAEFFERTNFYHMEPQNRLARGETKYVLADAGRSYLLYAGQSSPEGTLRLLEAPEGHYELLWLDCITGQDISETREVKVSEGKALSFKKPAGLGPEVALSAVYQPGG